MWSGIRFVTQVSLVALAVMFAAAATAQYTPQPHLRLDAHPEETPLVPGAPPVSVPVEVILDCTPPDAAPAADKMDVQIAAVVEERWVNLTFEPAEVSFDAAECTGDAPLTKTVDVAVAVADDAPAGRQFEILLQATMSGGHEVQEKWRQTVGIVMEADAWLGETAYKAGPNTRVQIPVHIQNDGNGIILATFRLSDDSSDALNVALPGQQVVEPGDRHAVNVDLQTPFESGFIDQNDTVAFTVVLTSGLDTERSDERSLAASIHTVGSYVPGPGPLLLVALVGLAWLVRRGTDPKP